MRKVEVEIIMCSSSFLQLLLQRIAMALLIAEIINGALMILSNSTKANFIDLTIFNLLVIPTFLFLFVKRTQTQGKINIDIDDGNVRIPSGSIITNSVDGFLFETVREYRFAKEETNEN